MKKKLRSTELKPGRVLCIEDQKRDRMAIELILESFPVELEFARFGDEAVDMLIRAKEDENPYTFIILDMRVPLHADGSKVRKLFGLELLQEMKKNYGLTPPGTPVIVYTAWPELRECVACIKAGAYDYITKGDKGESDLRQLPKTCEEILRPLEGNKSNDWLSANINELSSQFKGQFVVAFASDFKNATRKGRVIGGKRVLSFGSYNDAQMMIIKSKRLRWKHKIYNIPSSEFGRI